MAAARSTWKRLHTDLEDGDECLPISKRICSLHIESQTQGLCSQSSQGAHAQGFNGSCSGAGAEGSPFDNSHQLHSGIPHLIGSCRLDSLNEQSSLMRTSAQNGHGNSLQTEADQRHAVTGPAAHFCHSLSDPGSSNGEHHHKLDHTFNMGDSQSQLCMPASQTEHNHRVQHSHQMLQSSIHNGHPMIHRDFHNDIHSCNHSVSAGNPLLQGMPEVGQRFHLQQMPSGVYDPELGMDENPYYFSINQMLFEAHLCRIRRGSGFLDSS